MIMSQLLESVERCTYLTGRVIFSFSDYINKRGIGRNDFQINFVIFRIKIRYYIYGVDHIITALQCSSNIA